MVPSCAEGGVLGVLCASVGSIQVNEAIKLLMGIGDPLVGRLMIYDALEMTYRQVKVRKDPECAICGKNPTVTELIDYEAFCGTISEEAAEAARDSTISVRDLAAMKEAGEDFLLVDVREPGEFEIVSIPGAVLIPKGEFLNGSALEKMPQDRQIVVNCKTGVRSAEVLAVLKGAGFANSVHVGGGVSAWVNQIEPDKPSYCDRSRSVREAPGGPPRPAAVIMDLLRRFRRQERQLPMINDAGRARCAQRARPCVAGTSVTASRRGWGSRTSRCGR